MAEAQGKGRPGNAPRPRKTLVRHMDRGPRSSLASRKEAQMPPGARLDSRTSEHFLCASRKKVGRRTQSSSRERTQPGVPRAVCESAGLQGAGQSQRVSGTCTLPRPSRWQVSQRLLQAGAPPQAGHPSSGRTMALGRPGSRCLCWLLPHAASPARRLPTLLLSVPPSPAKSMSDLGEQSTLQF